MERFRRLMPAPIRERLGLEPPEPETLGLIDNYDDLNVSDAVDELEKLAQEDLPEVLEYEIAHKNRKTVIEAIARLQDEAQDGD